MKEEKQGHGAGNPVNLHQYLYSVLYWANDQAFSLSQDNFQFTWVKALFIYRISLVV